MGIDPITLGALIRKRRKDMGLTLNDLASDSISVPTISNIERGITGNLASEKVAYIREKLELTDELVEKMLKTTEEEDERLAREIANVRYLAGLNLLSEARQAVSALENDDKLGDYPRYATTTQLLKGIVLRKQGQYERAKNAFQQVLRLLREDPLDEPNNLAAEAYFNLSIIAALDDQDYGKAIEYAEMALDVFQNDGDELQLEGHVLYNIANYHFHLEQYGQAYKYAIDARPKCEQHHDTKTFLLTFNIEGLTLSAQHLYSRAAKVFRKAINLSRSYYADPWLGSILYLNLGDTLYREKAYEQSLQCYDISYRLCKETKDEHQRATLYYSYGEVYLAMGEYERATEFADKSFELAKKFHFTSEYLPLLLLKANIALEQGSTKVTTLCEEGIRLAEKSQLFNKMKDFHFVLANYYERSGNKEAFHQQTQHMYQVESLIRGR
ncbi:tetratricopeptide repeat protein [Numidum massiliense]|uniref:tetratricopeptide repeat protein n=1 Tax=Numidum massiliense TaxID=1522315 RepID=UPI0006D555AF|nr:tetratricopeptide repeat protein [Numidum massiliense]